MPDLLAQDELRWRRSSRSVGMNNCVEAARLPDATLSVRDSKNIARQALRFSPTAWSRFLTAVHDGTVD
ncbi:DUF397 domain-containing protein [Streptomyces lunaelactis]|uniref:DUF397 domain-containing protein n=1 Tax=Streptomyces lunaelactis TaxID=1535768 RepID=A0A2R4SXY8_9ACTN|nr:DUF397 domain-containing protein [Streptomyces lunaelactis]AVZ71746.1 DUF397 domain-containing protein [Streptomyces lunaelactis]NUJ99938.1 DUF397 domain-containing protein [Streptomyces lunaelactis]NUK07687.1 DUF397 domain-containing protein [Streptomyces lunaelactis]NUK16221.1 DUF397 domain-containing protein [Streptomyces lunaelactis]NUK21925.1 DUF397 domain-containing protein [Streptomyces lunaelactis]